MSLFPPRDQPIYLTADVRAIETAAAARLEPPPLMERAGLAAAEVARAVADPNGKPVLVLAGPGNNGGGALLGGRPLQQHSGGATVVFARGAKKRCPDATPSRGRCHA